MGFIQEIYQPDLPYIYAARKYPMIASQDEATKVPARRETDIKDAGDNIIIALTLWEH